MSKIAMKSITKILFITAIFGILLYYINIRYLINFKSKILILRNFYLKLKLKFKLKIKSIRRNKIVESLPLGEGARGPARGRMRGGVPAAVRQWAITQTLPSSVACGRQLLPQGEKPSNYVTPY